MRPARDHLLVLAILALPVLAASIALTLTSRTPDRSHGAQVVSDVHEAPWTELKVYYSVGEWKKIRRGTWATTDRGVLAELQRSFRTLTCKSSAIPGMMTTNEVRLTLLNGQSWVMYFRQEGWMLMQELSGRRRAFELQGNSAFHDKLKSIIQASAGTGTATIHFVYRTNPKTGEILGR